MSPTARNSRKVHVIEQRMKYINKAKNAARRKVQEEANMWRVYKNYPNGNMISMAIHNAPAPAKKHILVEAYRYANKIKNTNRNKSNYIKASANAYVKIIGRIHSKS